MYVISHSNYKKMEFFCVSILVGTIKFSKDHIFVLFMYVWKKNILEQHNVKIFRFLDFNASM